VAEDARPSRAEITELIFRPGLSVRDEATSVSGRGVGLDAVRSAVMRLGGRIDVQSDTTGTTFRLRLPVSLAMALALEVEVAGQTFFLPMTNVTSVGRLDAARLEQVEGGEVLVEADATREVRDLAELYGLGRTRRDRDRIPTVTLTDRDVDLVLLVDRLGRRTEIVVRPLGAVLPAIPGIVGSTELADGRTILVLEPAARIAPADSPAEAEA
jgi:two-component system chemotaxis sensor kinase CheA